MTTTDLPRSRADLHRPRFHLTPESTWMNDPNGLVLHEGTWHAFFQNNPHGSLWDNMSWGHAVSTDLATWTALPVALPCSEQEMIFSGSVVHDAQNVSGLGTPGGSGPLLAFYTSAYSPDHPEHPGIQAQSIASSTDDGMTWEFYAGNPVLDRSSANFRDPKVLWHEESGRWVMVAVEATDYALHLFTSQDLLRWEPASVFRHPSLDGGIWECPDLVRVHERRADGTAGRESWALILSTNPGGPAGGSGTWTILGDFDGIRFTASAEPQPLDLGPDCYAAVTFSGVDGDPVVLGWMNNWAYADRTPTAPWRSAMTLPRTLLLEERPTGLALVQRLVVPEGLRTIELPPLPGPLTAAVPTAGTDAASAPSALGAAAQSLQLPALDADEPFRLRGTLAADVPHRLVLRIGADAPARELVIEVGADGALIVDRSAAHAEPFAAEHSLTAPYVPADEQAEIAVDLIVDRSCVELELDGGRAVVSAQIFPGPGAVTLRSEALD
ncbi:GH32 C-terminal domain-containing protein [Brachybacterium sp. YJGR34]|uniref:GH32 C-terminal domain-containing protein n=1 Tax=Brachybacterium sp. YJGR34 TaxID=2059911 RepID=UPI000E0B2C8E|nr:GH32 C-terminal domain-containing protein [Brachybacterium sp. YJGR34]